MDVSGMSSQSGNCRSVVFTEQRIDCICKCFLFSQVVKTNQFSVTRHEKIANGLIGDQGLPGVFVLYELSPMMVKFTEKQRYVFTAHYTHTGILSES